MVSSLQFLLLFWISSTILEFSSSYADAAGSNVSAAKVRQISWKPRSVFFISFLVFFIGLSCVESDCFAELSCTKVFFRKKNAII